MESTASVSTPHPHSIPIPTPYAHFTGLGTRFDGMDEKMAAMDQRITQFIATQTWPSTASSSADGRLADPSAVGGSGSRSGGGGGGSGGGGGGGGGGSGGGGGFHHLKLPPLPTSGDGSSGIEAEADERSVREEEVSGRSTCSSDRGWSGGTFRSSGPSGSTQTPTMRRRTRRIRTTAASGSDRRHMRLVMGRLPAVVPVAAAATAAAVVTVVRAALR